MLFNKFERFLENTLEENLVLTEVLSQLAQWPDPVLRVFLFALPADAHGTAEERGYTPMLWARPGVRTLASLLQEVRCLPALPHIAHLMCVRAGSCGRTRSGALRASRTGRRWCDRRASHWP